MALIFDQKNLTPLTQDELDQAVQKHKMFRQARVGGGRAILSYRNMAGLTFRSADLSGADFTGSLLTDCDMRYANLDSCMFFVANLQRAECAGATLLRTDLRGANISGANFTDADLTSADMREGIMATKDRRGNINLVTQASGEDSRKSNGGYVSEYVDASETLFVGTRLVRAMLRGANMQGAILERADLSHAQMQNANLRGAVLADTNMTGVELSEVDMRGALLAELQGLGLDDAPYPFDMLLKQHRKWVESDGAEGKRIDFTRYDLRTRAGFTPDFSDTMLTMMKAKQAIFFHVRFTGARMQACELRDSDFRLAEFERADLRGSDFTGSNMARVNFRQAQLGLLALPGGRVLRTDFSRCNLRYTRFGGADLKGANLTGADLSGADMRGANMEGADMSECVTEGALF